MQSFSKKNPTNLTEKLMVEFLDKLSKTTHKFLNSQEGQDTCCVLSVLQSSAANFLSSVTRSCSENLSSKVGQLDYIEMVRKDVNLMFDQIKTEIKSVNLN